MKRIRCFIAPTSQYTCRRVIVPLKKEMKCLQDVVSYIRSTYLHTSEEMNIVVSLDGYEIMLEEPVDILHDDDLIMLSIVQDSLTAVVEKHKKREKTTRKEGKEKHKKEKDYELSQSKEKEVIPVVIDNSDKVGKDGDIYTPSNTIIRFNGEQEENDAPVLRTRCPTYEPYPNTNMPTLNASEKKTRRGKRGGTAIKNKSSSFVDYICHSEPEVLNRSAIQISTDSVVLDSPTPVAVESVAVYLDENTLPHLHDAIQFDRLELNSYTLVPELHHYAGVVKNIKEDIVYVYIEKDDTLLEIPRNEMKQLRMDSTEH